jgi:uncharacterized membrane protein
MRWLLWVIGGVLLGGIVHFVTVLALPETATQDAYTRLGAIAPVNAVAVLPQPTPQASVLPFMDPAFAVAVCLFDLSSGPLKLSIAVSQGYTSVSFYTLRGVAFYAINDRAAGRRVIELDLMTTEQRGDLPDNEEVTAADRLIVEAPTETGIILFRALAAEPGLMAMAQRAVRAGRCSEVPQPQS